jgi:hypothetical protein
MFPAFNSFASRPFASIVQIYGILNPRNAFCPCSKTSSTCDCDDCGGSGGGGSRINSSIDISFVQFAIKSILNVNSLNQEELLNVINQLVKKQLTYANYSNILNNIDMTTILNDPYFFFIYYSYTITDYQYIQLQLQVSFENLQKQYLITLNDIQKQQSNFYHGDNVDLSINTHIKIEYLLYMQYYGLPHNGIFLPSILERIKYGIINKDNYHFFAPTNEIISNVLNQYTESYDITIQTNNNNIGIGTTMLINTTSSIINGVSQLTTTIQSNIPYNDITITYPTSNLINLNTFTNKDITITIL